MRNNGRLSLLSHPATLLQVIHIPVRWRLRSPRRIPFSHMPPKKYVLRSSPISVSRTLTRARCPEETSGPPDLPFRSAALRLPGTWASLPHAQARTPFLVALPPLKISLPRTFPAGEHQKRGYRAAGRACPITVLMPPGGARGRRKCARTLSNPPS